MDEHECENSDQYEVDLDDYENQQDSYDVDMEELLNTPIEETPQK